MIGWPHEPGAQCRHNGTGEDNAQAHITRRLFRREVLAVTGGRLDLGPREQIFCAELDGRGGQIFGRVTPCWPWYLPPRSL